MRSLYVMCKSFRQDFSIWAMVVTVDGMPTLEKRMDGLRVARKGVTASIHEVFSYLPTI